MDRPSSADVFDVCIVGSGFGGGMAAEVLVRGGKRVLMVERGDWVHRGPENWAPNASLELTKHYTMESPYKVLRGGTKPYMGIYSCVGGPSVFYGGVALRFRERDFESDPEIVGNTGAAWPFSYSDLEPYYGRAETLLDVSGEAESDPTAPFRSKPYPQGPAPLSQLSQAIANAGQSLGLSPFPLPLAINHRQGKRACVSCNTCDTFACAISAKNDIATRILPELIDQGMTLVPRTAALRFVRENRQLVGIECFDKDRGEVVTYRAKSFVLAAGAMASPHLVLSSGLDEVNPAGDAVGRFLMRHANAIVFGVFPRMPAPLDTFHKQVAFHDFYFGTKKTPGKKLGCIQQLQSPPIGLVKAHLPKLLGAIAVPFMKRMTGLLVMAEDQPSAQNRVSLAAEKDGFGLPQLRVEHTYSKRDKAACGRLKKEARRILRRTGSWVHYTHNIKTFSHACGTLRMGEDERTAPVDSDYRFRGVDNLFVVDGSIMPTSAGLNPSLTIAANALRASEKILASGVAN